MVSAAAGATGSVAGMIAKIKGCRVIGIAGGPEKCRWVREEAGFDGVIDYKREDVGAALDALCPAGIDVYFDNVGGDILDAVLARLAQKARVVLCGAISRYDHMDHGSLGPGPSNYFNLVLRRSRMEGFLVTDYLDRFPEAVQQLAMWHAEGKVKQLEDVQDVTAARPRPAACGVCSAATSSGTRAGARGKTPRQHVLRAGIEIARAFGVTPTTRVGRLA